MLYSALFVFIIILLLYVVYLLYQYKRLTEINLTYANEIDSLTQAVHDEVSEKKQLIDKLDTTVEYVSALSASLREEKKKVKSTEVRTGLVMEKMAPFLEAFQHNPKNAHFLGQPIDYIVFNDDGVVFVEVKTGKSRLSTKQNNIKKLIEQGKVKFELVRFEHGYKS